MDETFAVLALLLVAWSLPLFVAWLRGRNMLGCIAVVPLVGFIVLWKVTREPATPGSLWAHWFYGDAVMEVSEERYPLNSLTGTYVERKEFRKERAARPYKPSLRRRYKASKARVKSNRKELYRRSEAMDEARKKDKRSET